MAYLENTEVAIKNAQSRKTGNIGYTRRQIVLSTVYFHEQVNINYRSSCFSNNFFNCITDFA